MYFLAGILLLLLAGCQASADDEHHQEYRGLRWWGRGEDENSGGMMGHGMMMGQHGGMMGGSGDGIMGEGENSEAMRTTMNLIKNRHQIERTVTLTEHGAGTYTRSDDPQVSEWVQEHVASMLALIEDGGSIREWDPLSQSVFDHSDDIAVIPTYDEDGVHVSLTGSTPCGKRLAQLHAKVVSGFIEKGHAEISKEHTVPEACNDM